jgi:hypothetical protein
MAAKKAQVGKVERMLAACAAGLKLTRSEWPS